MKPAFPVSPPAAPAIVNVSGLRRVFGERAVLDGLNLRIYRGEFVAMLGASGTGKSTFLRVLAGLDRGATGIVTVPRKRAVMFQDARLLPWLRVRDNMMLGLDRVFSALEEMLDEVGLDRGFAQHWPKTLSGGEAQRVSLARALMRHPELLLLDEPFGALDALTRIRMQELLARLHAQHQSAVLLVTHDVEEAIILADRVIVLKGGGILTDVRVPLPRPRDRSSPEIVELRGRLLRDLGVLDTSLSRESVRL